MPNPLDFLIKDPDAMRYQLMREQPMKKGGAAKKKDAMGGVAGEQKEVRMPPGGPMKNLTWDDYRHAIGMRAGGYAAGGQVKTDQQTTDAMKLWLAEGGPVYGSEVPAAQPSPEQMRREIEERSWLDTLGGAGEAGLNFLTGAVAQPAAGIAGAVGETLGLGRGEDIAGRLADALTYAPTTAAGQTMSQDLMDLMVKSGVASLPPVVSGINPAALRVNPGAGRYAGAQAVEAARPLHEAYMAGEVPGLVDPAANVVKPYYHGSDVKGLTGLDPEASAGRRSNGSSVWLNPVDLEAASYAKKKSGSVYEVPLDTEGFATIDAGFTSNKAISPDAVIQHSNGEVTPVSALGNKVTTDDIAAHSRAKGDPGVRILNVGDMGGGGPYTNATHGESVAAHYPVEVSAERNLKDVVDTQPKRLSKSEIEENLTKWFGSGSIRTEEGAPKKLYHITSKDFEQFKPGGYDPTVSGYATWLGDDPEYQPAMHNVGSRSAAFREGTNVMPVYANAKNPLLLDDPGMLEWAQQVFAGGSKEFPMVMPKKWADEVKAAGYDYIHHADPHSLGDPHEYIMLDPERQIKSALGNRGTYDPNDTRLNYAAGGAVKPRGVVSAAEEPYNLDEMRHALVRQR